MLTFHFLLLLATFLFGQISEALHSHCVIYDPQNWSRSLPSATRTWSSLSSCRTNVRVNGSAMLIGKGGS
uniref:Putative secreted protein n=1 Tax=Anopheles marajoara TaxID=58244 RepID=A0A2M4CEK8_9DIPT